MLHPTFAGNVHQGFYDTEKKIHYAIEEAATGSFRVFMTERQGIYLYLSALMPFRDDAMQELKRLLGLPLDVARSGQVEGLPPRTPGAWFLVMLLAGVPAVVTATNSLPSERLTACGYHSGWLTACGHHFEDVAIKSHDPKPVYVYSEASQG